MLSHLKRRVGVFTAIAVMSALVPALSVSTASAAPATALAPHTNEDSSTYSACPTGSAAAAGFTDTTSTDVDCIAMYGITTGVTATTYEPSASIPRWQMALYLTRMASKAGVTLGSGADQGFTDISGYSAAIQTAINQIKQLGVTTGTTATTYSPDDNVTREQMAMFIERLLGQTPTGQGGKADADAAGLTLYVNSSDTATANYNYDDIDSGSVTFEGHNAIVEMWQLGITGDLTTQRSYRPSEAMTRAEMATFVTNALGHTNVRPVGLWLQASKSSGFGNTSPTITASYRDSSHAAVSGKVIDFYEWENAATAADNSAHTAAGACATATAITTNSLTKCKVEVGDPTTNTKGNIAAFSESVTNTKTNSYFAWSAAAGTTFVLATHGSGTEYSTINVSSATPAAILLLSTDSPATAQVNNTGNINDTKVKFGTTNTITAQLSADKVGAAWAPVASPLCQVTFVHTIYAVGTNNVESVTTTKVLTDATGKATYAVTDADPNAASGDVVRHGVVVSDAGAACGTSTATTKVPAGYVGHFVGGTTVEMSFDDAAVAYNTTALTTNVASYKAGSALLPVARSATSTNLDQYGAAHTASSGNTVQFQGAAVTNGGIFECHNTGDLCYIRSATSFLALAGDDEITAEADDETWTTAAVHGLSVGDAIVFDIVSSHVDAQINADTIYYVKASAATTTFTLEATAGGSATALAADVSDCTASTCTAYQVLAHNLTDADSIIFRGTLGSEADVTIDKDTRYWIRTAGLTAHTFGMDTTSNATALLAHAQIDNCTALNCDAFKYHAASTSPDRTIGPDGTTSVAWNDTASTTAADTVSVYVSTTKEAAKTSYRYILPVTGTALGGAATAIAWAESAGAGANHVTATPLVWDNANNTLLVQINHGVVPISVNAAAADDAGVQAVAYLLYTYDDNDQFFTTGDATAAAATLAGFEYQLGLHLAAGTGLAFDSGDLYSVTYQALAANVSQFKLGT